MNAYASMNVCERCVVYQNKLVSQAKSERIKLIKKSSNQPWVERTRHLHSLLLWDTILTLKMMQEYLLEHVLSAMAIEQCSTAPDPLFKLLLEPTWIEALENLSPSSPARWNACRFQSVGDGRKFQRFQPLLFEFSSTMSLDSRWTSLGGMRALWRLRTMQSSSLPPKWNNTASALPIIYPPFKLLIGSINRLLAINLVPLRRWSQPRFFFWWTFSCASKLWKAHHHGLLSGKCRYLLLTESEDAKPPMPKSPIISYIVLPRELSLSSHSTTYFS